MSVQRITVIDVVCDSCNDNAEWIGVRTIEDGIEQARAAGWVAWKGARRQWHAACPSCATKSGLGQGLGTD